MSDKPFDPTPSRLARALREGDVALSQELVAVCGFAAALAACSFSLPHIADAAKAMLFAGGRSAYDTAALVSLFVWTCVPAAASIAAALASAAAQAGGVNVAPLRIDLARLSPAANLRRMISRETLVTMLRAGIAFVCAACALLSVRGMHARSVEELAWHGSLRAAWTVIAVGLVFAAFDFALQKARRLKRLRMSHDEVRRDHKEHEGDPLARSRRRSAHRAIVRGSINRVREAAFVITNPTHIAVALEYAPPKVNVPRVLVRAADAAAAAVRTLAAQYNIPVIENVALARELYARADAGDFIPHETYVAVAEVVAALAREGVLQ